MRYDEAIKYLNQGLQQFPSSRAALFAPAATQLHQISLNMSFVHEFIEDRSICFFVFLSIFLKFGYISGCFLIFQFLKH